MRVGIIRSSALGDIIVSAVFLPYFKMLYPRASIHWFVDEIFGDILEYSPCIDKLYKFPFKRIFSSKNPLEIFKLYKNLQACERYDVLIDMQGLFKSAVIGTMIKKTQFFGFDRNSIREKIASLLYSQKIAIPYDKNILERNSKVLFGSFGIEVELEEAIKVRQMAFGCSQISRDKIHQLGIFSRDKKNILFVLETSKANKTYPIEQYCKLARILASYNVKILLLWHSDFDTAEELFNQVCNEVETILLPKISLDELKALIERVDVVVGGDTGVTHLGWALDRASVTLYGNTPIKRFRLPGRKNIVLTGNEEAKYNKKDFSIRWISPKNIAMEIKKLL